MTQQQNITSEVFDLSVQGINLSPGTLGSQLSGGAELLVFLRHFG